MAAPDDRAAVLEPVMRGSRVISAAISLSLESASPHLTLAQLRALSIVNRRGPLNLAGVAEGLGVNPSNASRSCERLVRSGFVRRESDPSDKRQVVISITAEGRRALNKLMQQRRVVLQQVVDRMSPDDRLNLSRAMAAFADAADALTDEGSLLSDGDGHLLRWLG